MPRYYFPLIALLFTLLFFNGCMKHDPYTKTCNLSTGSHTVTAAGRVTYRITHTGSVLLDSLAYYGPNGLVRVMKPSLPYSMTADLPAGATLGLTAAGTAVNGQFHIDYLFVTATDSTRGQDVCAH
jgi:hypothetical protein